MTTTHFCLLLVIGILAGGFGAVVGSSLLVIVPALVFLGLPIHTALGTGKLSALFRDLPALINYHREGQVDLRRGAIFTMGAVASTIGASFLALSLAADSLETWVALCMIFMGVIILLNPSAGLQQRPQRQSQARPWAIAGMGLIIGLYDGLFGGGVSIMIILSFVWLCGHDFLRAVGTSKIPNLSTGLVFVAIFLINDQVNFAYAMPLIIGMALGGYFGSRAAIMRGNVLVRGLLILVVFVMSAKLLFF